MYSLPYFKEKDPAKVLDFIRDHPFAFICGSDANARPVATQIPCFIEDRGEDLFLSGHIMKQTDHHLAFEQNPNVLAVFTGAHTYVSASWYTNKQTASTWNYMSVHAKGRIRFLDEAALMQILRYTTDFFEDDPSSPASFDRLPPDYVQKLS
ncbi:MAG TPA: FMN-binding negative transcriptional regulator, partial [Chitinophagaceae bacterium]